METGSLDLLLQGPDAPALPNGLPSRTLADPPRLGTGDNGKRDADGLAKLTAARKYLGDPGADPNDIAVQRWSVLAPAGREGDELLDLLAPLIREREAGQSTPVVPYRVPTQQSVTDSLRWKESVYQDPTRGEEDRPRYLLVLGDLDGVSVELQQVLSQVAFVGRLCCSDRDGYANYVGKALASSRRAKGDALSVRLFCADDGTRATSAARSMLHEPAEVLIGKRWPTIPALAGAHVASEVGTELEQLTDAASQANVLLTITHGLGGPADGWSEAEQRAKLGALSLNGQVLTSDAASRRFVPSGAWFCLACFGVGRPRSSSFTPWLTSLAAAGEAGAKHLIHRLGKSGSPFVAALPKALLGATEGPLSIVGHIDLAWTYAFVSAASPQISRPARVLSVIESLVKRHRAGVAFDSLMRAYRDETQWVLDEYQNESNARMEERPYDLDPVARGHRWMAVNDLSAYILLGDPAVQVWA